MNSSVKKRSRLTAVLLASAGGMVTFGLSACGGDHHDSPEAAAPPPVVVAPPAGSAVPASAGSSVAAYIAYLRGLRTDETSAPVSIGNFVAPVNDTAAATPLS